MNFYHLLKEGMQEENLKTFVWTFFGFSTVFFLVYIYFSLRLNNVAKNHMDSFSKKIICIYSIGFLGKKILLFIDILVKTILWLLLAIDMMNKEIEKSKSLNTYKYIQSILEDAINLVF
jgi:hypothetical protein